MFPCHARWRSGKDCSFLTGQGQTPGGDDSVPALDRTSISPAFSLDSQSAHSGSGLVTQCMEFLSVEADDVASSQPAPTAATEGNVAKRPVSRKVQRVDSRKTREDSQMTIQPEELRRMDSAAEWSSARAVHRTRVDSHSVDSDETVAPIENKDQRYETQRTDGNSFSEFQVLVHWQLGDTAHCSRVCCSTCMVI